MKSRPSGEKRRKEMQRQERNREKTEKRKLRKEERIQRATSGTDGETGVVVDVDAASGAPLPSPNAGSVSEPDASPANAGPLPLSSPTGAR